MAVALYPPTPLQAPWKLQMAVPPSQVTVNDGIAVPGRNEALTTFALRPLRPLTTGPETAAIRTPTCAALVAAFHWQRANRKSIDPSTSTNMIVIMIV